jgi:hypothetical protein
MSLINEALKRARRAQPAAPSSVTPPLQPVEAPPLVDTRGGLGLPILVGLTLMISAVLLCRWFAGERVTQVRARSDGRLAMGAEAAAAQPQPPAPQDPPALAPVASIAGTESAPSTNVVAAPAVEPAATNNAAVEVNNAPPPVIYKLQGIFFTRRDPSALINGKTVFVGNRVGDARVVLIEKDAVTIVNTAGETNLLELP